VVGCVKLVLFCCFLYVLVVSCDLCTLCCVVLFSVTWFEREVGLMGLVCGIFGVFGELVLFVFWALFLVLCGV